MQLEFKVINQTLIRQDYLKPVEKSEDYLYLHFDFTSDWDGAEINSYFQYEDEAPYKEPLNKDNLCVVPDEVIRHYGFSFWLIGYKENKTIKITTNRTNVVVYETGVDNGERPYIKTIESETLTTNYELGRYIIELPNLYGTELKFVKGSGKVQLLGRIAQNSQEKVVLSEIDLPTEELVKNVTYNNETKVITITWDSGLQTSIPIGDLVDTYVADENTLTLVNGMFQIKQSWIDDISQRIKEATGNVGFEVTNADEVQLYPYENGVMNKNRPLYPRTKVENVETPSGSPLEEVSLVVGYDEENGEHIMINLTINGLTYTLPYAKQVDFLELKQVVEKLQQVDKETIEDVVANSTSIQEINKKMDEFTQLGNSIATNVETNANNITTLQTNLESTNAKVDKKQDKLIAGNGISIAEDGTISVSYANGDEVSY